MRRAAHLTAAAAFALCIGAGIVGHAAGFSLGLVALMLSLAAWEAVR